jgi:hypothetical protein
MACDLSERGEAGEIIGFRLVRWTHFAKGFGKGVFAFCLTERVV